ncbi:Zinc finger RING/FYVE/PHD-type protein [Dioscorea alata]|uniref:Zinc finger RING/FYVE/PHD-type protein n=4 Tax=Dioscorea alata TaxID=55571 RepID=A0ACB7UGP9_DIOAL|nr:Zinc finger RING/FYVE/PHD-type protein [Dioscorea alata]
MIMGLIMETKGKEQFVDVHYVNTAVPCVVEEYYVGFPQSHEDQDSVYQTARASSSAGSRSDFVWDQSTNRGSSLRTASVVRSQLAIDEALARELQELQVAEVDITSKTSAKSSGGQYTSITSDQVVRQDDVDPDNMTYEELQSLGEAIGAETKGLSDELISFLPTSTYKTGLFSRKNKEDKCVICHDTYKNRVKLIHLPCQHNFHSKCVAHWLKINKACPICKEEVFGS